MPIPPMDKATNNISLREATYADTRFAYKVKKAALGKYADKTYDDWNIQFLLNYHVSQWILPTVQVIVANGVDVGWIGMSYRKNRVDVDDIYILPSHQRRGIGRHVLGGIIAEATKLNKPVRVWAMKVSTAIHFYEKLGFTVINEIETHWQMEAKVSHSLSDEEQKLVLS
jgi:GNAT superfamily N-acetyltransferase